MKESLDRSEVRRMQREQERERRRIRDRQRRQSMTFEQRERHLARRRRNYQLRRLRAENAKLDFPSDQLQISNDANQHEHEHEEEEEEAAAGGGNGVQQISHIEKLSAERLQYSECLEAVASKSVNIHKRLRLSHVRRLARSLNHVNHVGGEVIGDHQIVADMMAKGDASNTACFQIGDFDSGRLPNGLRFNRVKRLARTVNIATNETSVNGQKGYEEKGRLEQNVPVEEIRVTGDDKPKSGQTISVGGEVEEPNMDG